MKSAGKGSKKVANEMGDEKKPKVKASKMNDNGNVELLQESATEPEAGKRPEAPKPWKSPYMCYLSETFPTEKENNPNLTDVELSREIGLMFHLLDLEQELKYKRMARDDYVRFKEQWETYQTNKTGESDRRSDADDVNEGMPDDVVETDNNV